MRFALLQEWLDGDLPLLDIREDRNDGVLLSAFENKIVIHLPFSSLLSGERSCELPPRHTRFAILMGNGCGVAEQSDITSFFFATVSKATQQSRMPWLVQFALVASPQFWNEAKQKKVSITLPEFRERLNRSQMHASFTPQPRLWKPDPMVSNVLWPHLRNLITMKRGEYQTNNGKNDRHQKEEPPSHLEIWDLGCGSGRDVCFLAEQLKAGGLNKNCTIVGIDNHKGSAWRCLPLWNYRSVGDLTTAALMDLNKVHVVREALLGKDIICFYAVRFWNKKLVVALLSSGIIQKDTLFACSHFCKASPGAAWDFEHPKEKRVLERNELRTMFDQEDWEILHDELETDGDHGRTLQNFVARKC